MGPLNGVRIIELAGIGPGPFCGMVLADLGAEVISVERVGAGPEKPALDCSRRGKRSIALNLKSEAGVETLLKLVDSADALFEGFRPGVVEKLGIGPDQCLQRNPRLIYGRMTGWGQYGPMSQAAGHDINYISLTGALHAMGRPGEKPVPPLNLVGDFGGGGMFLALGIVSGLLEARSSGKGQVVDAAMTDGSAVLMSMFNTAYEMGLHSLDRGTNRLDGGAHFYDTYETLDGQYISIGSIEPQFYAQLLEVANLPADEFGQQMDRSRWPDLKRAIADVFRQKTRDQWCELMEGSDICFAPVLDLKEAQDHPHNVARQTYVDVGGIKQPAPAPRFSRTEPSVRHEARPYGSDTEAVLTDLGYSSEQLTAMREQSVCG
ncbi:CaiB/BaiF CoA-transferase family protein [Marinobacter sp.]|uniref:CaiB/BaiF CoA transferase family protein n=1 Tax=Marinobacter sp. TaxID=50741 RepID=UPI000C3A22CC|nr:CaiB/BaiF CoA-transferase family protein [Marinobacter sp.]MBE97397.1 carnitine dehydratase [Marinobacter sp.]|tara:strand:- start:37743 stop:38873 length:1131 start_codon:yes stop_codon:yes gene_type:complete